MRITCIIGPYMPIPAVLGGAVEKIFLALCEEFAAVGHDVTMISRRYDAFPNDETRDGIRHLRIASRDRPANAHLYRLFDILYAWRVRRAVPAADITITNSVSMPLIISHRRAGKIYVDVARYPKGQMGFYRRVDRLQACSTHIARAICEQSPSVAHLVKAIPNALTRVFADRAERPSATDRPREIVFVGRVAREKGIDLLLKAFVLIADRHPEWRLIVVGPHLSTQGGDGDEFLAELKTLAAAVCHRVDFVGPIFDEVALADRYERSSIFVYPSVAEKGEAFPVAPLEAMACGCAPIVSDLRCFDDAVTPGENAIAFDHRDETGATLAAALDSLIASDDLRAAIAVEAKATSRRYVPAAIAALFLADFGELTGLRPYPRG